jgi:hypothetical protein
MAIGSQEDAQIARYQARRAEQLCAMIVTGKNRKKCVPGLPLTL